MSKRTAPPTTSGMIEPWKGTVMSDRFEQRAVEAEIFRTRQKVRPDPATLEGPAQLAVGALALILPAEQLLGRDDVALHADDLHDMRDPPHAVAHAVDLDDQMHGGCDLGAHRAGRQVDAGHANHVLKPGQRLAWEVRVDRGHRAIMTRVHRL